METFFDEVFAENYKYFSISLLVGILGFLSDLLLLYIMYRKRLRIRENGQETTGRIIDRVTVSNPKEPTSFLVYRTIRDHEIAHELGKPSRSRFYKNGKEVTIIYNPEKPGEFIIEGDKALRFLFYGSSIVWAVLLILGIVGLIPLLRQYF